MNNLCKDLQKYIITDIKQEYEKELYEAKIITGIYRYLLRAVHDSINGNANADDIYNQYDREISQYLLNIPYGQIPDDKMGLIKKILNVIHEDGNIVVDEMISSICGTLSYSPKSKAEAQKVVDLFKLIDKDYTYVMQYMV